MDSNIDAEFEVNLSPHAMEKSNFDFNEISNEKINELE